jgi:purine-nucleoside phosphorylase
MSIHIGAKPGEIAPTVLFPGDPLRARHIAKTMLENSTCVNEIRGMLCFTGSWEGKPVSVMGSGMGQPSLSIYANELYRDYDVQSIIRIGSAGSLQESVKVGDIVLAQGACTNAGINRRRFSGLDYAPISSFDLLQGAWKFGVDAGLNIHVGNVLSTDSFYDPQPEMWKNWAAYGVLAVEMESSELLTLAASYRRKALGILTISDSLVDSSHDILADRETGMTSMAEMALSLID